MSLTLKYAVLLALVAVVGCSDRSDRQDVDSRNTDASRPLIVVTQPTEPPFAYRDSSGDIVGTDIDLARRILRPRFHPYRTRCESR